LVRAGIVPTEPGKVSVAPRLTDVRPGGGTVVTNAASGRELPIRKHCASVLPGTALKLFIF